MTGQRFSIVARKATEDYENISDSEYRTLAVIVSYCDADGWCYPAYPTIAARRKMSISTIRRHVNKLAGLGYLLKETRQKPDGSYYSNRYFNRLDYPYSIDKEGGGSVTLDEHTPSVTMDGHIREPVIKETKDRKRIRTHWALRPKGNKN